jgi:hypothetical protein
LLFLVLCFQFLHVIIPPIFPLLHVMILCLFYT